MGTDIDWNRKMPTVKRISIELLGMVIGTAMISGVIFIWTVILDSPVPAVVYIAVAICYLLTTIPTLIFYPISAHEDNLALIAGFAAPLTDIALLINLVLR